MHVWRLVKNNLPVEAELHQRRIQLGGIPLWRAGDTASTPLRFEFLVIRLVGLNSWIGSNLVGYLLRMLGRLVWSLGITRVLLPFFLHDWSTRWRDPSPCQAVIIVWCVDLSLWRSRKYPLQALKNFHLWQRDNGKIYLLIVLLRLVVLISRSLLAPGFFTCG